MFIENFCLSETLAKLSCQSSRLADEETQRESRRISSKARPPLGPADPISLPNQGR